MNLRSVHLQKSCGTLVKWMIVHNGVNRFTCGVKSKNSMENENLFRKFKKFSGGIEIFVQGLIPETYWEIPRDLFVIIATLWINQAEKGALNDSCDVLKHIRDRAWLGYVDTPALIRTMRADLPHSLDVQRLARYFEEISEKRSNYLFLPIVSRIERYQVGYSVPDFLKLDAAQDKFGHTSVAGIARKAFALAPQHKRERDAFLLALMGATWGKGDKSIVGLELLSKVVEQLRLLYKNSKNSLGSIRSAASTNHAAAYVVEMADEVSRVDPPLWLETLIIVEYLRVGSQFFPSAIKVINKSTKQIFENDQHG